MADLMSGSFNYSALEVQYDHFSVPAAKIKVNGMDIIGTLKLSVSQIQVDLTAKEASSVNFTIDNVFSLDTRSFAKTVSSVVRLGSVVTVELGYGSSYTAVFKGYIAEISYDYSDAPGISVTALDVMRLLMENSRINYRYTEKTYTAVVKTVLAKYLTLCSDLRNVETTTEQLEGITQNGTDYDFLKKIAKKANKEFFIFSGAAYFRTPGKNNTAVMTLEWGKNLMEFRMSNTYCHERITVQGIDAQKHVTVESSVTVKAADAVSLLTSPLERVVQKTDLDTVEKAKKLAESMKREKEQQVRNASGSCIGLPQLVPGRFIYVKGLNGSKSEKYYLKSVKHSFGSDGFSTSFTTGAD